MNPILKCFVKLANKANCGKSVLKLFRKRIEKGVSTMSLDTAMETLHGFYPDSGGGSLRDVPAKIDLSGLYDLHIVVPIYNVEDYVETCVDSIVSQRSMYKVWISLINDGSTDDSRKILEKYVALENVEIIDQPNKGPSGARNRGLDDMKACYVAFVDSDDYLVPGAIKALMDSAYKTDSDIVQGGYYKVDRNGLVKSKVNMPLDGCECNIAMYAWGKVYKSTLFEKVKFPEGHWFEDTLDSIVLSKTATNITLIPDIVYAYRRNEEGICFKSRYSPKSIDSLYVTKQLLEDCMASGLKFDGNDYENYLSQVRTDYKRIVRLGADKIAESVFVVHCNLRMKFFAGFSTRQSKNAVLEKALCSRNYELFQFAVILMK